jgi:coproporphyrinogen III oxidase-like Fe-S oxidoreductase
LTPRALLEEALFTGLRLTEGVDAHHVGRVFDVDPLLEFGAALGPFFEAGVLWQSGSRFGLTRRGMLVANEVMSVFV